MYSERENVYSHGSGIHTLAQLVHSVPVGHTAWDVMSHMLKVAGELGISKRH